MFDWIVKKLKPPGIHLPGRRKVFSGIAAAFQIVADDAVLVMREWFPFTASEARLREHGRTAGIPEFQSDTPKEYRMRVASAAQYLERQGRRSFVRSYLDRVVPGRYRITEYPLMGFRIGHSRLGYAPLGGGERLFIRVRNITPFEQEGIYNALDRSLDPDIEISILDWVYLPVSAVGIDLIRRNGGSRWITSQLDDIGDVHVEFLPDDGFRIGHSPLGQARLLWTTEPVIMVTTGDETSMQEITDRLGEMVSPEIERRVYSG